MVECNHKKAINRGSKMKIIEVSGAILVNDGEILCAQRNKGKHDYVSYKYELYNLWFVDV